MSNLINFNKSHSNQSTSVPSQTINNQPYFSASDDQNIDMLEKQIDSLKIQYNVISASELISKIEKFIEKSKYIEQKSHIELKKELVEIDYYLNHSKEITSAAFRGGLLNIKEKYNFKILQIKLLLNHNIKIDDEESKKICSGMQKLILNYKIKQAYLEIFKGEKFKKAGLLKDVEDVNKSTFQQKNPIAKQSKENITKLINDLKNLSECKNNKFGLDNDEIDLFTALLDAPYKLQHATNSYYPIINSGILKSYTELKRDDKKYNSQYSTKGNIDKLGNDGFIFFRLYIDSANNSKTRYGETSLIFDLNILRKYGWISLHDQLKPFSKQKNINAKRYYEGKRLIRVIDNIPIKYKGKDETLMDGLSYKYRVDPINNYTGKKDMQNSFGSKIIVHEEKRSFLEEIFYAEDILLGISLSIIRELRYLKESGYRKYFLDKFKKLNKDEHNKLLGQLLKELFRIEGKYPVSLQINDEGNGNQTFILKNELRKAIDQQFQVVNKDGDGSYNPDLSINENAFELGKARTEKKQLKDELSNCRRLKSKCEKNKEKFNDKIESLSIKIENINNRLLEIKKVLENDSSQRDETITYFCQEYGIDESILKKIDNSKLNLIKEIFIDLLESKQVTLEELLNTSFRKLKIMIEEPYCDFLLEEVASFNELTSLSEEALLNMQQYNLQYAINEYDLSFTQLVKYYCENKIKFRCYTSENLNEMVFMEAPYLDQEIIDFAEEYDIEINYQWIIDQLCETDKMIFIANLIKYDSE